MKNIDIVYLVSLLGLTYEELVGKNVISDEGLIEVFPGAAELFFEIDDGIEMSFNPRTKKFQTLNIAFKKTTPSTVAYRGELPAPFKLHMTQEEVRTALGAPRHYSGPVRMPEPMGQTGGWESYHLTLPGFEGTELIVGYTETLYADGIAISNFLRENFWNADSSTEDGTFERE